MFRTQLTKVQKSNEINQANFSDFSLSCYRVILHLISQIQRNDMEGKQLSLPIINRQCSLSAENYAKEFNLEGNTAYEILKEATDKLMKTTFLIQHTQGILKINVCSQALYVKDKGRIDIKFTEEIMPHLAELNNNFTMYNLNEIAGFNSFYTTRFYELLMQYKTTGELNISVAELRFKLGCTNILVRYNDFKKYTFGHAINEINSQWLLNLKFEEIKNGRSVETLIFTFKKALQQQSYDFVKKKIRTQLIRPKRKINKAQIELPLEK